MFQKLLIESGTKGLMFKLIQNGIEGKHLEWLNSYLSQRKQKVGIKVTTHSNNRNSKSSREVILGSVRI